MISSCDILKSVLSQNIGLSYTGSTHVLGTCRLGSIPSSPTMLDLSSEGLIYLINQRD